MPVLAPADEILFFARTKKSIQKKNASARRGITGKIVTLEFVGPISVA
ncbi:hypothetical protein [Methyloglobulus morosus]|nr:hypothetical protein [Methyloglobulus morosus]